MTEEQMNEEQTTEEKSPGGELLDEIQSLGDQLVTAVRSLWESEDSRKVRQEIGTGFSELGRQLESAIQSAQESEAVQQFEEQVKETVDKARETDIAGKIEAGLATGLRELNEQLSKLVGSAEEAATPEEEPETAE